MIESYTNELESYFPGPDKKAFIKNTVEFAKPAFIKNETTLIGQPYPDLNEINELFANNLFDNLQLMKDYFESDKCEKQRIEWLTITNTLAKMTNFNIKGKIHLTCKSHLQASLTSFESLEPKFAPACIEIFANSHAEFDHCYFHGCQKSCILLRDFSWAKFTNCIFEGNFVSCLVQNNSYASFENCLFINDKHMTICINKSSKVCIKKCEFKNDSKSIFAKGESKIKIEETVFEDCSKGAATVADKSIIMMNDITINNSLSTAVRVTGRSTIKAKNVKINNSTGNAINVENGDGYFYQCKLTNNTQVPTISVRGRYANPVFAECEVIDNGDSFAAVIKNCARPLFANCLFENCYTNCFSISDFSMPLVKDCQFVNISKYIMNIYGKSNITLIGDSEIPEDKIKLSSSSKIFNEETRIEVELFVVEQTNEEENNDKLDLESYKPPSYQDVPTIDNIEDPENMFKDDLSPLPLVSIEKVIEKEDEEHPNEHICLKCCNHDHHQHEHEHKHNDEEEELYVSHCGHCFCKDCIESKCPVCDTVVQDCKKVFREEQCVICMDHAATTIISSCGHMCMCYECAVSCVEQNFKCPLCNQPIISYKYMID